MLWVTCRCILGFVSKIIRWFNKNAVRFICNKRLFYIVLYLSKNKKLIDNRNTAKYKIEHIIVYFFLLCLYPNYLGSATLVTWSDSTHHPHIPQPSSYHQLHPTILFSVFFLTYSYIYFYYPYLLLLIPPSSWYTQTISAYCLSFYIISKPFIHYLYIHSLSYPLLLLYYSTHLSVLIFSTFILSSIFVPIPVYRLTLQHSRSIPL